MDARDPYGTRIPDGQYRMMYERTESGVAFGARRWFAWFTISEPGPNFGLPIVRFYNVPKRPWLPRSHNLRLDYVQLTGRKPPSKLKPEDFLKGLEVLGEVVTVKRRAQGKRRVLQPEELWYSKVDRLVGITAGSPPCPRV